MLGIGLSLTLSRRGAGGEPTPRVRGIRSGSSVGALALGAVSGHTLTGVRSGSTVGALSGFLSSGALAGIRSGSSVGTLALGSVAGHTLAGIRSGSVVGTLAADLTANISSPSFSEGSLAFNVDGAATVYAILSNDPVSGDASSLTGSEIKAKQQAGVTGTVFAVATGAVTAGANSISIDTSGVPVGERVLHIATENGAGFDTAAFEVIFEEAAVIGIGAWIIGTDFTVAPPEGSIGNATVGSTLTVAA